MKRILGLIICCFLCSGAWAQQPYPVSRETFMKLDEVWAETVAFSRSLNDVIKDEIFGLQREEVVFLQRDLSGITFSLLTLITMIEMEFIHAEAGQINSDVLVYIDRFSSSLRDIVTQGIERNSRIILVSKDRIMADLYEKVNRLLEKARSALADIRIGVLPEERILLPGSDLLSELDELIKDTGPGEQQEPDFISGGQVSREKKTSTAVLSEEESHSLEETWSMTRYNPATGYVSYYTRDGRLVGKEKRE